MELQVNNDMQMYLLEGTQHQRTVMALIRRQQHNQYMHTALEKKKMHVARKGYARSYRDF